MNKIKPKNIAIIFAGGVGSRMGATIPKQFLKIYGKEIIIHTLEKFQYNSNIDLIYVGCIEEYLNELGIDFEVDPKIVRGLDYYNHTVFEIEAEVKGFGSNNVLGGGGRYNSLVDTLGGPKTPAVGFASGLDRLIQALDLEEVTLPINEGLDVFVMYVSDTEKKFSLSLVQELRMNGFKVDTEYTSKSLKAQFKQADRLNSKFLIILNDEDLKNDEITIKNNETKEETKIGLDYLIYYLDEQLMDFAISEEYDYAEEECDCDDDCDCGHHH